MKNKAFASKHKPRPKRSKVIKTSSEKQKSDCRITRSDCCTTRTNRCASYSNCFLTYLMPSGYNEEIGRDLGLEGDPSDDAVVEPPVLTIKAGLPGYDFEVAFKKKNHGGIRLEFARKGADKFLFLTNKMKSPAVAEITPLVDGSPELVRIRAIYLENDEPVGEYSPEYPVTIVP